MRRGLISWSRAELPEVVLESRVARVQTALAVSGLDALVVYTTPARAAAVAWLAGFVPYWNQGVLVVPREGAPTLISALSNRVADWLKLNAHVDRVMNSPRIGAEAATLVGARRTSGRVGVVDLTSLPAAIISDLTTGGLVAIDATELLATERQAADPTDIALHARAAAIAHRAISLAERHTGSAAALVAAIESQARGDGAEEIYPALAVDLRHSRNLVRLEGDRPLADAFAIRLSVAYKGAWVRLTRTVDRRPGRAAAITKAAEICAASVTALPGPLAFAAPCRSWLIEATRTTTPLEPVAGSAIDSPLAIGPGQLVNVHATLDIDGGPVLLACPVLTGVAGRPGGLLAPA